MKKRKSKVKWRENQLNKKKIYIKQKNRIKKRLKIFAFSVLGYLSIYFIYIIISKWI